MAATAEVIFYVAAVVINTAVIILDVIIIYCSFKTGEIRRNIALQTIFISMAMDIAIYPILIVHDMPSFIMNSEVFSDPVTTDIMVLIIALQWFAQLFVLLVLSVIHALAVFAPNQFRTFSTRTTLSVGISIVAISILFTVPLFTPWCGYAYFTEGQYWAYDPEKPYTDLYATCNRVLQGLCAFTVACVDVLIIWRLRKIRVRLISQAKTKLFTTTTSTSQAMFIRREPRTSREVQLAVSFVLLSVCFLLMTTFYNFSIDAFVYGFITKLTYNLNLAKWSIYFLGNANIRRKFLSLLRCGRSEVIISTS